MTPPPQDTKRLLSRESDSSARVSSARNSFSPNVSKILGDAHAHLALDHAIRIDEPTVEHTAEVTGKGRLAGAQKTDKEDVVAPLVSQPWSSWAIAPFLAWKVAKRTALEKAERVGVPHINMRLRFNQIESMPAKREANTSV